MLRLMKYQLIPLCYASAGECQPEVPNDTGRELSGAITYVCSSGIPKGTDLNEGAMERWDLLGNRINAPRAGFWPLTDDIMHLYKFPSAQKDSNMGWGSHKG